MDQAAREELMRIIETNGKKSANNTTAVTMAIEDINADKDLYDSTFLYIWERGLMSIMNDWRHHEREKAWTSVDNVKSVHESFVKQGKAKLIAKAPRVSVSVMRTLSKQVTFSILTDWTVDGKRLGDLGSSDLLLAATSEKKNAAGSAANARFFEAIAKPLGDKKVKQVWDEVQLHFELDKARKAEEDIIKVI